MQNNTTYVNIIKHQIEHEKRKKEELFNSNFFKILSKENENECTKLIKYLEQKTCDEIEKIMKFIMNKKSVQKIIFDY